jgi:hypothetical protein
MPHRCGGILLSAAKFNAKSPEAICHCNNKAARITFDVGYSPVFLKKACACALILNVLSSLARCIDRFVL